MAVFKFIFLLNHERYYHEISTVDAETSNLGGSLTCSDHVNKFQFKQKNMTNVACFHGQNFLCSKKIPLVLLAFAITFTGINTLRG